MYTTPKKYGEGLLELSVCVVEIAKDFEQQSMTNVRTNHNRTENKLIRGRAALMPYTRGKARKGVGTFGSYRGGGMWNWRKKFEVPTVCRVRKQHPIASSENDVSIFPGDLSDFVEPSPRPFVHNVSSYLHLFPPSVRCARNRYRRQGPKPSTR